MDGIIIFTATETDSTQIHDITARAGVFSQEEIDCVPEMFNEYLVHGAEGSGDHFIVYREGEQVLGFAIYSFRDLTDGVYDLYWIAVDPNTRRKSIGRRLLTACEDAVCEEGGRIILAETSGTAEYELGISLLKYINGKSVTQQKLHYTEWEQTAKAWADAFITICRWHYVKEISPLWWNTVQREITFYKK